MATTSKDSLTLTDFLLARIEEDEALARSARERALTPWRATYGRQVETSRDGYLVTPEDEHSYTTDPPEDVALHIARHDPARVLAECEAKRRIIMRHVERDNAPACTECGGFTSHTTPRGIEHSGYGIPWPCPTLRHLALPYSDHPDFREEWKL